MRTKFLLLLLVLLPFSLKGQTYSLSTNVVDWVNCGTLNVEGNVLMGRHFSFVAGGKYNPWVMNSVKHDILIQNKNTTVYAGARYWPWYVFSGWWVEAKAQYQSRYCSGLWRAALEDYMAVGAGLSAGYSIMVTKSFNIDVGIGGWGGQYLKYNLYHCQDCMEVRESGQHPFIRFDDISVSLTYVF